MHVVIAEEWLGGEIWHAWFAARARMLEYTRELERKTAEANLSGENKLFVLALCSDGFRWQQDGLEDFVSFYYSGVHRGDDAFSKAELRYISDKKITLNRTISQFAYMKRAQSQIRPARLNWNVLLALSCTAFSARLFAPRGVGLFGRKLRRTTNDHHAHDAWNF